MTPRDCLENEARFWLVTPVTLPPLQRLAPLAFAVLLTSTAADAAVDSPKSNSVGMTLHLIEGGRFIMGSDARENGLSKAFPLHTNTQFFGNAETPAHVTWITKPIWMGETEVTVGQWKQFIDATGYVTTAEKNGEGIIGWAPTPEDKPLYQSHDFERKPEFSWRNPGFPQTDSHPVVGVSFEDVQAFLKWLSKKEGATYRLPTEAEWEFACRAGTTSWFSFGDEPRGVVHRHGNLGNVELEKHRKHSVERQWLLDWDKEPEDGHIFTSPVGSYEPNALGLRDLHGNVWEWCADLWLDTYYQHFDAPERTLPRVAAIDPVNESEPQTDANHFRTIRGGSWYNGPIVCRSSNRSYWDEPDAACYLGFRVVREADPAISSRAREALEKENAARTALEQAGAKFFASRGINLEVRFDGETLTSDALQLLAAIPDLESLSLGQKKPFTVSNTDLEAIAAIASLKSLDFRSSFEIAEADLSILAKLPLLESLSFSRSTSLNDADLAELASLENLRTFRCYGTTGGLTDEGIVHLARNHSLETLDLFETDASGSFLNQFTACPIASLSLTKRYDAEPRLTDEHARLLANFPALIRLQLNEQGTLTDPTLLVIGKLTQLEELTLHGCRGFSANGFAPLGQLTHLRTLNLQSTAAGDEAANAIADIPRLQSLRLGSEGLTDRGIARLADLFSLENLYIETCAITDVGLESLGRINRLKQLDLGAPTITGSGLGALTRLPELSDLRLRCPALTNAVFEQLVFAKSLRKLRLVERGWQPPAALTDEGLLALAPATWLTELWLPRNDTGLTEDGMNALKPHLPKTNIIPYSVEWKKPDPS